MQTEAPATLELQAYNPTGTKLMELTGAELQGVSGGLNPQPLPPREVYNFLAVSAFATVAVWAV